MLNLLGLLCFPFCHVNQCKTTVDRMIKVFALATESVQTTPARWFCLLSDYCIHICVFWMLFCVLFSSPTLIRKLYVEHNGLVPPLKNPLTNVLYCWQESLSLMSCFILLALLLNQLQERFCNTLLYCILTKVVIGQSGHLHYLYLHHGTKATTIDRS